MPWKECVPMDEKLLFIADHLRAGLSITELCLRYGISRKTGYKWIARYRQLGTDGLQDQSRRPRSNCFALSYAQRQVIVKLRIDTPGQPGPKKLLALLRQQWGEENTPSKTAIYNILKAESLIQGQRKRRRVRPTEQPLRSCDEPNGLWSVDYKGQFKTADGRWCYPLTIMDHASRYLLAVDAYPSTNFQDAQQSFARVFREHGLPDRIRSDNGAPFASTGVAGLSRLAVWWIRLGIRPERIERGKPQQNGRHERMHRTLKQALGKEPAADRQALQVQLDAFRQYYNTQRPHESLAQQTPSQSYKASEHPLPQPLPPVKYLPHWETSAVSSNGLTYWRGLRIYIGYLLVGQEVGLLEIAEGQWEVYFADVRIGCFNENDKGGSKDDYITLKVLPMSVN